MVNTSITSSKPTPITKQNWPENSEPLVSISCITFNHENFIRDAIEGFLMQKTTFPVEILIHDDASTDKTPKIIREYEEKYPFLIKPIYQITNQYSQGNSPGKFNRERARGKYYAICEGDDYWTDPLKLQKQVDFLEENEEYVMSYGNALIQDLTNNYHKKKYYLNNFEPKTISKEKVFGLGVPTCTMVFRSGTFIPKEFSNVVSGDQFLRLFLSQKGLFYYHGEVFGLHRKHPMGISRTTNKFNWHVNTARNLKRFLPYADTSQKKHINQKIVSSLIYAFFSSLLNNKKRKSLSLLQKIVFNRHFYSRSGLGLFRYLMKEIYLKKNVNVIDTF